MDKYVTLEYSWVKVTTVSMRLQIYLYALTNTNKLCSAIVGDTNLVATLRNVNKLSDAVVGKQLA
jgi:hypothetical protein